MVKSTTIGAAASKAVATDATPSISQDAFAGVSLLTSSYDDSTRVLISGPVPTAVPQTMAAKI
jgi:O-methyltransferase involved in polyketide biosynthesis